MLLTPYLEVCYSNLWIEIEKRVCPLLLQVPGTKASWCPCPSMPGGSTCTRSRRAPKRPSLWRFSKSLKSGSKVERSTWKNITKDPLPWAWISLCYVEPRPQLSHPNTDFLKNTKLAKLVIDPRMLNESALETTLVNCNLKLSFRFQEKWNQLCIFTVIINLNIVPLFFFSFTLNIIT